METSAGVRVSLPDRVTLLMLVDSVSGCAGAQTVLCRNKKKKQKTTTTKKWLVFKLYVQINLLTPQDNMSLCKHILLAKL